MVGFLVVALANSAAIADSFSTGITVTASETSSVRTLAHFGFDPTPSVGVDLFGGMAGETVTSGLGLTGRYWLAGADTVGEGVYVLGRFEGGMNNFESPWTSALLGFGARPTGAADIWLAAGPDFGQVGGISVHLGASMMFGGNGLGGSVGEGWIFHNPRKPDGR